MTKKDSKIEKNLILSENKFPVVGVGASAGGLAAFTKFVKAIPANSGIAYVFVQHLDPSRESLLPELLQKNTNIPVLQIADDIIVEPDNIYIIPSNQMLLSNDGKLELEPRSDKNRHRLIDLFFTSLALVHRSHSIGVVLSGSGTDGTQGLKAIKEQGGITFAQNLESAEFNGMPRNAIEAEVVDFVSEVDKIPEKIIQITQRLESKTDGKNVDELSPEETDGKKKIISLLRNRKGTDFTYYKETTIYRRILRRMALNNKENLTEYFQLLKSKPSELDLLYQDLLIPITDFFRDAQIFNNLCNTVFPYILKNKEDYDPFRIWVAGCSTGEEVYTILICLLEFLDDKEKERIQIFGTDISEPAVAKARSGIYKKSEVDGLSPERLKRFFTKTDGSYQINKSVREKCIFAIHDFLKDPPFGKMDFISCRNVLIYMQPYLQKKAITTFHYALKPSGYLLLGKSESISNVSELFIYSQKRDKIFIRKDKPGRFRPTKSRQNEKNLPEFNTHLEFQTMRTDFQKIADDIILNEYTPAGVVVNESFDIVHFRGKTSDFLEQMSGKPTHNLLKMAKTGFAFELRNILHKVKKEQENNPKGKCKVTKENIPVEISGKKHYASIEAVSLPKLVEPHYLILFHDHGPAKPEKFPAKSYDQEKDELIRSLQDELAQAREDMRSITEEQETINQDLQSANEELQSSSEELQSLNEELETSQEELQSTNEELSSVNQELINLNSEYVKTKEYAESIIDTIPEPLLILDKNLRMVSASKNFYKTFKVTEKNIRDRPVFDIGNGQWNIPELKVMLNKILPEKAGFQDLEVTHDFPEIGVRTMILKARQIQNTPQNENLILLVIEDITDWEITEKKLILSSIVESSEDAIISKELNGIITSWNKGAEKILGYTSEEIIGKNIRTIIPPERREEEDLIISKIKKGEIFDHFETERLNKDGKKIPLSLSVSPIKNHNGKIVGASKIARDISKQQEAARKLEISEHRYRQVIASSPSLIATFKGKDLLIEIANDAILEAWGKGKDVIGKPFLSVMPELVEQGFDKMFEDIFETGKAFHAYEMPVKIVQNGKETLSYFNFIFYPEKDIDGNITGVVDIATEVTPQALMNKKIKENEEKFRQLTNLLPDKITRTDAEGNVLYYNRNWKDFFGISSEKLKKEGWFARMHPEDAQQIKKVWQEALNAGTNFETELRLLDHNNQYVWHLHRAVPLFDENNKVHTWITATTEIQTLKEEERRKEDFLKMVSHELKTPVTSIKGYVQMLLNLCKTKDKNKRESFPLESSLERIDVQITRLTRLIFEMLDLSRLEDQTLEFKRNSFSLNKLVKHTVEDIERTNPNCKIIVKNSDACEVVGDEERIAQVLINFITNAIKYSPNKRNVDVNVHKTRNGGVAVSVRDYGIGIDKKDQKKIFERFYRVAGQNQETYAGFGIGLYLCNEIIKRHNGAINVKSKKDEGSEFTFVLPCEE
ncbi:MAG TPA: PAS domain S-box protein [Flavobacteriaceae bacterium]|nr:PAS domain S-box protein [Flavobacteriaceae bacterium]